jgi:hypothetical protein
MKTVKRRELGNDRMIRGNEKKFDTVILDGNVKKWVGIGWICHGKATAEDQNKYPTVVG